MFLTITTLFFHYILPILQIFHSFKAHFRFGIYLIGAMVQCETLKEFGKILFHVTVLCTTTYEKHAKHSFEILQEIIEQRPCVKEICKAMVS